MEFGDAYDSIPPQDRDEFISDFAKLFSELHTETNCHFAMVLAKNCKKSDATVKILQVASLTQTVVSNDFNTNMWRISFDDMHNVHQAL